MELSDRIEHQWTIIDHITSYIQAADSKAASGLGVLGIFLGFLLNNKLFPIQELLTSYEVTALSLITILVFCMWVALVMVAMYYALLCLVSRTGSKRILRAFEPAITRSSSTNAEPEKHLSSGPG